VTQSAHILSTFGKIFLRTSGHTGGKALGQIETS